MDFDDHEVIGVQKESATDTTASNLDDTSSKACTESDKSLATKTSHPFGFPFVPYENQIALMQAAYQTYQSSSFALLESPTGTGKSLSLICSALTWLREFQQERMNRLESRRHDLLKLIEDFKRQEEQSSDWLSIQTRRKDVDRELETVLKDIEYLKKFEEKSWSRWHAKMHASELQDYVALSEKGSASCKRIDSCNTDKSLVTGTQEDQLDMEESIEDELKEIEEDHLRPKVYFASRTHSQLTQFVNEIKRTTFADSTDSPPIRVTALASRANLCANPDVMKLKDPSAINERCMELQRETSAEKRCSYAKLKKVKDLKEQILSSVHDIEDIVKRGQAMGSCPYYAARMSVAEAEVVMLPYNNLLHHETRKASSLDLKDNIVVVDEAHNLLETICNIHSANITGRQLIGTHTLLSRYYRKFHKRMSPKNALMIKTIVEFTTAILRFIDASHTRENDEPAQTSKTTNVGAQTKRDSKLTSSQFTQAVIEIDEFVKSAKVEQFNVYRFIDYFNRSQLARKLMGLYHQDNSFEIHLDLSEIVCSDGNDEKSEVASMKLPAAKKRKTSAKKRKSKDDPSRTDLEFLLCANSHLSKAEAIMGTYPVYQFIEFLKSLTNLKEDGKLLMISNAQDILQTQIKYILLNPSRQFDTLVKEARSIVLAGGTMQPFDEFVNLLFRPLGIDGDRVKTFSCDHVIRKEQLYAASLCHGPTGKPLELSFKTRASSELIDEIGLTLMNIANVTPGGIVCFLPSYDYENFCFNRWAQSGLIAKIEKRAKQVFREPRQANQLKTVWDDYVDTIKKGKSKSQGAVLFCVVGGKMSEGINFNDDLGRCIIMIGLPYANIKSIELRQKMDYYDRACKDIAKTKSNQEMTGGQQYYENLCIKGVNQSIGRAIRHKNDYAAIVLLDRRYAGKESIRDGLPGWIKKSMNNHDRFGTMFLGLKSFFNRVNDLEYS